MFCEVRGAVFFIADLSEFRGVDKLRYFIRLVYFLFSWRIRLLFRGSCAPRCRLEGLCCRGVGSSRATLLGALQSFLSQLF